jgi:carbonic anhydrase
MSKFRSLISVIAVVLLIAIFSFNQSFSQDGVAKLKDGNERYVTGHLSAKDFAKQREDLVKGQKPYVIVVTCSDSRVAPEYIFDESLGQIFVIRVAGNVVSPEVLGSVEYAFEHLHCNMLVIMGHERCGAVKATLEGGKVTPNIASLLYKIKPAVTAAKAKKLDEEHTLEAAIEENVHLQIKETLRLSKLLKEGYNKGELKIYSAIYELQTGKVQMDEYKEK